MEIRICDNCGDYLPGCACFINIFKEIPKHIKQMTYEDDEEDTPFNPEPNEHQNLSGRK